MESLWLWLVPLFVAVILLVLASLTEYLWKLHKILAEISVALLVVGLPFIFLLPFAGWVQFSLAFVQIWLLLLPARLIFGRLESEFLRNSTAMSSALGLLAVSIVLLAGVARIELYIEELTVVLVSLAAVVAVVSIGQISWTHRHYRVPALVPHLPMKELPTVSICIPARNETHALTECIAAALRSDYPKLEILVLDDCSQDKTSDVIRSFAHDGVRFVKGSIPAEGWLGRNQAMSTLAHHATGKYLLFVSVDTILDTQSVTRLVSYANERADMISVLPYRLEGHGLSTVLTTMQYFWQIALPITKRRVPVSSKCWLVSAAALRATGGFDSVRQKIVPEGSFARKLFAEDTYRFVVSDRVLNITSSKTWVDQVQTSLRLLYPTFKRQPMYVLGGLLALLVLCLPFVVLVQGLLGNIFGLLFWLCAVVSVLLLVSYCLVLVRIQPRAWFAAVLCLPLALVQEALLLLISMLSYEFSEVNWKGRNVCYPVLHPQLQPQVEVPLDQPRT